MNFAQDKQMSSERDGVGEADVDHRALLNGFGHAPPLPPAMMPGKGVRAVRCVGCRQETLPRPEDSAPLCQRCDEVLSSAFEDSTPETWAAWTVQLAPRWLRRRSSVSL